MTVRRPVGGRIVRRSVLVLVTVAGLLPCTQPTNAAASPAIGRLIPVSQLPQRLGALAPQVVPERNSSPGQQPHGAALQSASTGALPTLHESMQGIFDNKLTPPDTNGAAGLTRQIEIVNGEMGIWDRLSPPTLLATGDLQTLTGSSGTQLYDPRVIWDPQAQRFFYSMLDDTNDALLTGFSTTSAPTSMADWCRYAIPQVNLMDQPHLGDSRYFMLIGFFLYFNGPEVAWYAKPPAGPTCPTSLASGMQAVPSAGELPPVPAHEIDAQATGYVLSADLSGGSNSLTIIRVTRNASGLAVLSTPAPISVPGYGNAPSAPQLGASRLIVVGDARLEEVVGAIDPSRAGKFALWTDHTVGGGAGSEIRWYEIDPSTNGLLESGKVQSPTLWAYDGTISPDRLVNGSTRKFGDSMVLTFNTSSSSTHVKIWVVSKIDSAAQSAPVLVKGSTAPYLSSDCAAAGSSCHWGDYSGEAPDPTASPTGAHGVVWGANEWNVANPNPTTGMAWRTWIFTASP
jgi:hypothetical protein